MSVTSETAQDPICPSPCVMATSFLSQHSLLAAFKEQPNCSVQQGLNPLWKMGHQVTYKMPLTPGQLWCSENSGLGRIDIFLFRKGNKDSGCHGRIHLHSTLVCLSGRASAAPGAPAPILGCVPPNALSSWRASMYVLLTERIHTATDSSTEST